MTLWQGNYLYHLATSSRMQSRLRQLWHNSVEFSLDLIAQSNEFPDFSVFADFQTVKHLTTHRDVNTGLG